MSSSSPYSARREKLSQSNGIRQHSAAISAERVKKFERGRRVDVDEVVLLVELDQRLAQLEDLVARFELALLLGERRMRGQHVEPVEARAVHELVGLLRLQREAEHLVEESRERRIELAAGLADQVLRRVALWIAIDHEDARAARGTHRGQVC